MRSAEATSAEEYDLAVSQNKGLGVLFFQQVKQNPTAIAVVDGQETLTYEILHYKAVHLAQELRHTAFDPEEPVGIVVQHGIWDVVSQMGIVYAGGSCATMDPTLPDPQIKERLRLLGARYILVDKPNSKRELPFISIEVDRPFGPACIDSYCGGVHYPTPTTLEHRSHLIHTSATTGTAKAVQIAARSVLEVAFHAPFERVHKSDVVAHVNNTSFDVALFDIWGPLLNGAQIAVVNKSVLLDLQLLSQEIDRLGITFIATTTALLNLAASTYPRTFSKLRMCWIGGEAANMAAIKTVFEAGPPQNLINAYGPTECCVLCTAHRITDEDVRAGHVSIGKPTGRGVAYICDELGTPVEKGQEGELWIGGPGVSPGYVNQPKKNLASFVTVNDPTLGPMRMYRTGDIVKQRTDGQIDYLGRRDNQVKVRGFRIELEAIESAMISTGEFSEAVAMRIEGLQDGAGSMLVAFGVPVARSGETKATNAQERLAGILPNYMIPRIELVDSMPLNNHAKVDRKELSRVYHERRKGQTIPLKGVSGDMGTRSQLALLWASILGSPVPFEDDADDFFQLGGTSLQAALLISQIERSFDSKISLLSLYGHSSLGALSTLIEQSKGCSLETVHNERDVWVADTKIADDLPCPLLPAVDWRRRTEGRVFFTGATGFVGAFMLADVLRMPGVVQVGCLVRASNAAVGFERLHLALEKYGVWEDEFAPKLLPFCGNLEDQWLGLGREGFEEVGHWASVIFHLGARVNYTQPYSLHRPANTEGTVNIVRLACTGRTKALHYISSISCFGPTGLITGTKMVREDESLVKHLDALPYDHGYAQSQWVAEELLRRLMDRGFPIAVYRPGFITGHSQTGACNPDDFFSRLISACMEMGCYPELPRQRKEFVPVDWISSAVLHIAASPSAALGHAFHLVPPTRELSADMDDSMEMVGLASGQPIKKVPYHTWIQRLADNPPARLLPLQPMLAEKVHDGLTRWELYENMPIYDTTNTEQALASYPGGLEFPPPDSALMKRYLDYIKTH